MDVNPAPNRQQGNLLYQDASSEAPTSPKIKVPSLVDNKEFLHGGDHFERSSAALPLSVSPRHGTGLSDLMQIRLNNWTHDAQEVKSSQYVQEQDPLRTYLGQIENLVLEGGGMKGLAYFSALEELSNHGLKLDQLKQFAGTSAGSCMVTLLSMGLSLDEVKQEIIEMTEHNEFRDGYSCLIPWRIFHGYSFYNGKNWVEIWQQTIKRLWKSKNLSDGPEVLSVKGKEKDPTFADLQKARGVNLVIAATNLTKGKLIFYSPATTPDLPLYKAITRSSSIPGVWRPKRVEEDACKKSHRGDLIVDGGLLCNYPLWVFDHPTDPYAAASGEHQPNMASLGLKILAPYESMRNEGVEEKWSGFKIKSFGSYASAVLDTLDLAIQKSHIRKHEWERTVPLKLTGKANVPIQDIHTTTEKRAALEICGRQEVQRWVAKKKLANEVVQKMVGTE